MTTLSDLNKNPLLVFPILGRRGFFHFMDDERYLRLSYKAYLGRELDLENPKGFNEKLQWLKLHDRNPLYTTLVDKYRVKQWVAEKIGEEYVTETFAYWHRAEDIDIADLPERFVLKPNHDSGSIVICRDRSTFDLEAAKKKLAKSLRSNFYWGGREWPYKNVEPLIFAEEYLDPGEASGLTDYKLMCFGGEARCIFTCTGRADKDLRVDFFDMGWNRLPFTRHYPNADVEPPAPEGLAEMARAAEALSAGIPFVRVDFYEVAGRRYFGEMTFYPGSGFEEFDPEVWDETLGSWIELPCGGGCLVSNNGSWLMWVHPEGPRTASSGAPAGQTDYKFYCFGGEPGLLYVSQGLEDHATARISFLDAGSWSFAGFGRPDYAPFEELPPRPASLGEMLSLSRALSEGMPFVRADFFEYGGRPRFSEMTLYPCSGFMQFDPLEWDERVGELLTLPNAHN